MEGCGYADNVNIDATFDLTQLASDDATNIGEYDPSSIPTDNEAGPGMDIWGYLKRRDGHAEFQLRHRIVDGRRDTYLIGRNHLLCDLVVDHRLVSKTHCSIYCEFSDAKLRVYVRGISVNGTFVNSEKVRVVEGQQYELKTGDDIFLTHPLQAKPKDIAQTCFMFVNLHERLAFHREVAPAPQAVPEPSASALASSSDSAVTTSFEDKKVRLVEEYYILGEQIGSGMCGQVHLCVEKSTGIYYACKVIDTKKYSLNPGLSVVELREEAELMRELNHPSIVRIIDTFESDTKLYIVMELIRGGDLFDRIVDRGKYNEAASRRVMTKIMSAVQYLHDRNIIHRDLKPENILLVDPKDDCEVKLTDFGLAKKTNAEGLKTFCGTPQYFAPEVLKRKGTVKGLGRYGTSADMWSLGVILYILLSGTFPFEEDNLLNQIARGSYTFSGPEWENVSNSAKDLIQRLLTVKPEKRLNISGALAHPWITGQPVKIPASSPGVLIRPSLLRVTSPKRARQSPGLRSPALIKETADVVPILNSSSILPTADLQVGMGELNKQCAAVVPDDSPAGTFQTPAAAESESTLETPNTAFIPRLTRAQTSTSKVSAILSSSSPTRRASQPYTEPSKQSTPEVPTQILPSPSKLSTPLGRTPTGVFNTSGPQSSSNFTKIGSLFWNQSNFHSRVKCSPKVSMPVLPISTDLANNASLSHSMKRLDTSTLQNLNCSEIVPSDNASFDLTSCDPGNSHVVENVTVFPSATVSLFAQTIGQSNIQGLSRSVTTTSSHLVDQKPGFGRLGKETPVKTDAQPSNQTSRVKRSRSSGPQLLAPVFTREAGNFDAMRPQPQIYSVEDDDIEEFSDDANASAIDCPGTNSNQRSELDRKSELDVLDAGIPNGIAFSTSKIDSAAGNTTATGSGVIVDRSKQMCVSTSAGALVHGRNPLPAPQTKKRPGVSLLGTGKQSRTAEEGCFDPTDSPLFVGSKLSATSPLSTTEPIGNKASRSDQAMRKPRKLRKPVRNVMVPFQNGIVFKPR